MAGDSGVAKMIAARLRRAPVSMLALLLLVGLTATTASAAIGTIATVSQATDRLFRAAIAPDAVQMHSGELDPDAIERFAASRDDVRDMQIESALTVPNADLTLNGRTDAARTGVMELLFVRQNPRFDLLLGSDNRPLALGAGEIAVPVAYQQEYGLAPGDRVVLETASGEHAFTVVDLLRDAQMNPSIVNSKRFLVSDADWATLAAALPQQYLVAFRLDPGSASEFQDAYRAAGLPENGPAVDGSLLRLVTVLADGVVAGLILLVSIVFSAISLLCLRLVILTTIEHERRRIGLLRTLGFSAGRIIRIDLAAYALVAIGGAAIGLACAWPVRNLLTAPVERFAGRPEHEVATVVAMIGAAALTAAAAVASAAILMRRLRAITPLAALRDQTERRTRRSSLGLRPPRRGPDSLWLAARSRASRPGGALLLVAIIATAVLLSLVPVRVAQTVAAPEFVTTMGVGDSDLRVFAPGATSATEVSRLQAELRADPDVTGVVASASYSALARVDAGQPQTLAIESIESDRYPVTYRAGGAAENERQIAVSSLAADALGVTVGDHVTVAWGARELRLSVSGIYHDITNGGRSAKTPLPADPEQEAIWYAIAADVRPGADPQRVASEVSLSAPGVTVTDLDRFTAETLGDAVDQLRTLTLLVTAFALALVLGIIVLSSHLEAARDQRSLTTLHVLGYSTSQIRSTLILRTAIVAVLAAPLGVWLAEQAGPLLLGALLASLGGGATPLVAPGAEIVAIPATIVLAAVAAAALSARSLIPALASRRESRS